MQDSHERASRNGAGDPPLYPLVDRQTREVLFQPPPIAPDPKPWEWAAAVRTWQFWSFAAIVGTIAVRAALYIVAAFHDRPWPP